MSEPVFSEAEYRVQQLECVCLLREREELKQEIERLRLENTQLHTECGHLQADLSEQRAEISRLNDEISYYESLTGDECQDWPHRDGRYREWLYSQLRQQLEKFEGLRRERDEAREAATWLVRWIDEGEDSGELRASGNILAQWPWLRQLWRMSERYEKLDEAKLSRQLMEAKQEIERLRSAIYQYGESPMEHRIQIDPVQYLHARYVTVSEHNRTYDAFNAEIERLREAVWRAEADTQMHKRQVKNAYIENSRLRELVNAQEELLACYWLGSRPSEKLMDRLDALKKAGGGGG